MWTEGVLVLGKKVTGYGGLGIGSSPYLQVGVAVNCKMEIVIC
jgi:hypothetical protein